MHTTITNKQRNFEAVNIHRPLVLGLAADDIEAAVNAIIRCLTGVDLGNGEAA